MFIIQAYNEYSEIAKSSIGEDCFASYAFLRGHIYIRSDNHLYCIGK
jgi:hypothetical protein